MVGCRPWKHCMRSRWMTEKDEGNNWNKMAKDSRALETQTKLAYLDLFVWLPRLSKSIIFRTSLNILTANMDVI